MTRLQEKYQNEILPKLAESLKIKNPLSVPKLEKIVINIGLGEALQDKQIIGVYQSQLAQISGQKPVVKKAQRAISGFKLRAGDEIGLSVTLRRKKMYDFLDKLINIVLPRVRDFHGVKTSSFDGKGNYSLGITEQTVFPEIDPSNINKIKGLQITIVTTARNDEEAKQLLESLGMPFRKKE